MHAPKYELISSLVTYATPSPTCAHDQTVSTKHKGDEISGLSDDSEDDESEQARTSQSCRGTSDADTSSDCDVNTVTKGAE